jgi:transposase
MQREFTKVTFTGQDVYAGIDIGKKSWTVCVYVGQEYHKRFVQPPHPEVLAEYLRRNFPGAVYHSVYEAGYFGFWIHEALVRCGIDSMVINPADVPTTDKERSTKTDRVDAGKLARALANQELRPLYVPEEWVQEDRSLVRMRMAFVRKQTRCKCQIKALLRFYGFKMPDPVAEQYWSRTYLRWLEGLRLTHESGTIALKALLNELFTLRTTIAELTRDIRRLADETRYRTQVELLRSIPGISTLSALVFLTEVISVDRFKNLDRLACFVGLVPGEKSSGEIEQDTGLSSRRNTFLRYTLIECAWVAQREDPALLQAFTQYCQRMPKSVAIVHVARKLLSRMRFVLKNNQPYVSGVLKAA